MSKKNKKKRLKKSDIKSYPTKEERLKDIEKRLVETKKIQPGIEPEENRGVINDFYKKESKNKVWNNRREWDKK